MLLAYSNTVHLSQYLAWHYLSTQTANQAILVRQINDFHEKDLKFRVIDIFRSVNAV
jgi:hypothetical protein